MSDNHRNPHGERDDPAKRKPPTKATEKLSPDERKGSDGLKPQKQRNDNNKSDTSI